MQSATFELIVEELDQRFIEALKVLFSGKRIKIQVIENSPPQGAPLTLSQIVASNRSAGTVHQFSGATLDFLLKKMIVDEGFDLAGELEQFRTERS